ncbi:MAG: alanine dehydrogenase [Nocardioidaceae bacterium]|nr:alanine dehydrogenase [Nocardioidaceae bacterium]
MTELSLGVLGRSRKPNERRLAIHPRHVERIDAGLRGRVYLEAGYGEAFGVTDVSLARSVGGVLARDELIERCDIVLLPKPLVDDVRELRDGQVLWGWPHCVQNPEMTQLAVDKRLTLIAFEAMNHWTASGDFDLHVFHQNNELAGFSAVLHALALVGRTGQYGRPLSAAVIGFGSTARGAIGALQAQGVHDVTVLSHRPATAVAAPMHGVRMLQLQADDNDAGRAQVLLSSGPRPVAELLTQHDIVVNCVLQDTDAPLMFVDDDEVAGFAPGSLIVDVSCDERMGFGWARPTSFADPVFTVGDGVSYYAVDHTPSWLWDSATWEISEALLPHLAGALAGPSGWEASEVLRRAIEIRDGVIQNPAILSFQQRVAAYPHARSADLR